MNREYKTKFSDWRIDGYTAKSPDGLYELWIANGFLSFDDYYCHYPKQTLLTHVNIFQKYKLWKEIKKELKLRTKKFYE